MQFYIMNAVNRLDGTIHAYGVTSNLLRNARVKIDEFTPPHFDPAYFITSLPALVETIVIDLTPAPEVDETPVIILTPAPEVKPTE